MDGLSASVQIFQNVISEVDATTVMDMIIVTQYFDMMKDIGEKSKGNTLFIDHSPAAIANLARQIRCGFLEQSATPVTRVAKPSAPMRHAAAETGTRLPMSNQIS